MASASSPNGTRPTLTWTSSRLDEVGRHRADGTVDAVGRHHDHQAGRAEGRHGLTGAEAGGQDAARRGPDPHPLGGPQGPQLELHDHGAEGHRRRDGQRAALVVQLAHTLTDVAGAREPGRGVDALGARGRGGVLCRPGAERPGHQADRVEHLAPRAEPRGPGDADERHEVGGHGFDRVGGAGTSLGERHDGVLHIAHVGLPVEGRSQCAGRRVGPLLEEQSGAGRGVPAVDQPADRPVRRRRPVDERKESRDAVHARVVGMSQRSCLLHT